MEHIAILNYVEVKVVVISINQMKDVLYITLYCFHVSTYYIPLLELLYLFYHQSFEGLKMNNNTTVEEKKKYKQSMEIVLPF